MAWQEDGSWQPARCGDCGCIEGGVHDYGCDMERCPYCGHQLISCGCCYRKLGIHSSPGTWTYENGLTEAQEAEWLARLEAAGRIPYIDWPNLCAYCGRRWPEMFHVSDAEWAEYIQPDMRRAMVCTDCYRRIKTMIDTATQARAPAPR